MSTRNGDEPRRNDWTEQVDDFLARVKGMPASEVAARYGVGKEAVLSWRRKRDRGDAVTGLRAKYQEALLRALELDVRVATIPILKPVKFRRATRTVTKTRRAPA